MYSHLVDRDVRHGAALLSQQKRSSVGAAAAWNSMMLSATVAPGDSYMASGTWYGSSNSRRYINYLLSVGCSLGCRAIMKIAVCRNHLHINGSVQTFRMRCSAESSEYSFEQAAASITADITCNNK